MDSTDTTKNNEVLSDLILINNDRIRGYQTAVKNLQFVDSDLAKDFDISIRASHQFRNTIARDLIMQGGEIPEGISLAGTLYKVWMEAHSFVNAYAREAILANCEHGEKAAIAAYDAVLEAGNILTNRQKTLIEMQRDWLKLNLRRIQNMRQRAESMSH